MNQTLVSLTVLFIVAAAVPVLGAGIARVVRIPLVVLEIVLGLILGPAVLGWIQVEQITTILASLGVAMLLFLAGSEIDFGAIAGRPLRRSALGWLVSLAVGVAIGIAMGPTLEAGIIIGICLTSTALGTIMPVLRDAGEIARPFGRAVIAAGAVGQFGPLLAVALFLSGRHPLVSAIGLLIFIVIAGFAIWCASRGVPEWLHRVMTATLRSSGQLAVRLVIAVLVTLACLGIAFGLDVLVGAFVAGVLSRVLLSSLPDPERDLIEGKLEAVGFGFLIPVFFIMTGVRFDLWALLGNPQALVLMPVFVVLFLVVRGLPASLAAPIGSSRSDRVAMVLYTSTALAIVVAITNIGLESGVLDAATAAALVGAGLLSVLIFPLVALALRTRSLATAN